MAAANSQLSQADFPDFNDPNKLGSGREMADRLTNLIGIFERRELDFSRNRADGDDILGDAYEYLMRHFATESGKSKGQFYTPAEVSRIMAKALGIGDGIRQLISNQKPEFNEWFFTTVALVMAGSDSEGLQYGTTGTPEKYFLRWKEDEDDNEGYKLDKYLRKMCRKDRLLELMHDFVLYDGGVKKLPRVHQYFGV